jgi:hypothetical protein
VQDWISILSQRPAVVSELMQWSPSYLLLFEAFNINAEKSRLTGQEERNSYNFVTSGSLVHKQDYHLAAPCRAESSLTTRF